MTFHSPGLKGSARRRLLYSIAASLLLHLLLLWPASPGILTKDTPSQLQASLRPLPRLLPAPAKYSPKPPQPAVAPAPTLAPPAYKPAPSLLERPAPASVPQVLPAAPDFKPAPGPVPPAAAAMASAVPPAAAASASPLTEAGAPAEVVDGLRGYRLAVATQARRFKRYPTQAMVSGWAGSADIRVEVGRDGRPRAASVARSSGHEALDQAALAMIDAGALRARVPDSLRGQAFAVVLPVVFNLEDR